jgi:hypothetical protein
MFLPIIQLCRDSYRKILNLNCIHTRESYDLASLGIIPDLECTSQDDPFGYQGLLLMIEILVIKPKSSELKL